MRRLPIVLLSALVAASCQDSDLTRPVDPQLEPTAPDAIITEEGNGHFFFLPPLDDPDAAGTFNPDLLTTVRICEWDRAAAGDGDPATDPCVAVIESFGPDDILVDEDDEEYHVNWSVRNTSVGLGTLYAVQVLASGISLGSAEVVIGRNARQAQDFADDLGGDVIPLNRNQTLPIKYRIEYGLFCGGSCVETTVTDEEGGTFTTEDQRAGTIIPPDALPDGVEDVTLIIEEVDLDPGEECLGGIAVLTSTGTCIRFDTEPKLDNGFDDEVIVGICRDDGGVPTGVDPDNFLIHRFDPDNPGEGVEALPSAAAPFLDCSGFQISSIEGGPLRKLAYTGFHYLRQLIGPTPLSAGDEGFGGVASRFSHFQWALPVEIQATSPVTQAGSAGQPVADDPEVLVLTSHNDSGSPQVPAPGQTVEFEFLDADGTSLGTTATNSNAAGIATVPWTLSANAGTQRVIARALNADSLVFEATALGLLSKWTGDGTVTGGTIAAPGTVSDDQGDTDLSTAGTFATTMGVVGNAMVFTRDTLGSGNWAWAHPAADISGAGNLSVNFWLRLNTVAPGTQRLFSIFNERFVIRATGNDDLQAYSFGLLPTTEREVNAFDALQVGCWHHVAATYDGNGLALYLDGQLQDTSSPTGGAPATGDGIFLSNSDNGSPWPPRTGANAAIEKLDGAMDEIEVHNLALSAADVQARFDAAVNAGVSNLCGVGPNLQIGVASVDRPSTQIQEFSATVTNAGNEAADTFSVALLVDGETPGDPGTIVNVPVQLAPGAQTVVSRRLVLGSGTHLYSAIADYADTEDETAENDNTDQKAFTTPAGTPGLVSYYSADSTLVDSQGGHDLVQQFADPVLFDANGVNGAAFRFSRSAGAGNGALRAAGHPLRLAHSFTTSFWVNIDSGSPFSGSGEHRWFNLTGGEQKLIVRQNGLSSGDNSRNLATFGLPGGFSHTAVGVLQSGCWNHIAVSYDGATAKLYLNNSLLWTSTANIPPVHLIGSYLQFGAPGSEQVVGRVDEINVYNEVLTAAEIQSHFQNDPAGTQVLCSSLQ